MDAVEFIREHGIHIAKLWVNGWINFDDGMPENDVSELDVKRFIESHNLVENATPEELYKASVQEGVWSNHRLKQAIDDMEELNEED